MRVRDRQPSDQAVGGVDELGGPASSTARSSPARPTGAGCGWCCGRPRRCCCCATTGSCATSPGRARRWWSCPSGDRARSGDVGRCPRVRGAHRPPHPLARASDGTDSPAEAGARRGRRGARRASALTDHDTAEGWAEAAAAAAEVGDRTWCAGMEISTVPWARGVHLLAYLPDPTYPPLADRSCARSSTAATPGCRRSSSGCASSASTSTEDVRRAADGTAATGRPHVADALVDAGRGARPDRGVRALPQPGPAGLRRPLRRAAGEMIRVVVGAGGRDRARAPVGPHGAGVLPDEAIAELRRARAGRHRGRPPGPRRRRTASGSGRSRATSAWWSPAPATTTAPARSTTSSAATPPPPRSTSGCSTSPGRVGAIGPDRPRGDLMTLYVIMRPRCSTSSPSSWRSTRSTSSSPPRDPLAGRHAPARAGAQW